LEREIRRSCRLTWLEDEAVRDLCRVRDDARRSVGLARHGITSGSTEIVAASVASPSILP
jgi:hypothetical protein